MKLRLINRRQADPITWVAALGLQITLAHVTGDDVRLAMVDLAAQHDDRWWSHPTLTLPGETSREELTQAVRYAAREVAVAFRPLGVSHQTALDWTDAVHAGEEARLPEGSSRSDLASWLSAASDADLKPVGGLIDRRRALACQFMAEPAPPSRKPKPDVLRLTPWDLIRDAGRSSWDASVLGSIARTLPPSRSPRSRGLVAMPRAEAIFERWDFADFKCSLQWEPGIVPPAAFRADASTAPARPSMAAANVLGLVALAHIGCGDPWPLWSPSPTLHLPWWGDPLSVAQALQLARLNAWTASSDRRVSAWMTDLGVAQISEHRRVQSGMRLAMGSARIRPCANLEAPRTRDPEWLIDYETLEYRLAS